MKPPHFSPDPRVPYMEVVGRLQSIRWGKFYRLGFVSGYPLWMWQYSPSQPARKIHLSAGIHGDEPGGVECVLALLEDRPAWLTGFELTVFPCLNPWGYEHNTRTNQRGKDVNRQWRRKDCKEIGFVHRALRNKQFDLSIGLHEDYDATGFYIYELVRGISVLGGPSSSCWRSLQTARKPPLTLPIGKGEKEGVFLGPTLSWNTNSSKMRTMFGPRIIKAVSRFIPIERRQQIEGRRAQRGVLTRPTQSIHHRRHWPEALYQIVHHANHTLTMETPTSLPIEKRVRAHIEGVHTALKFLRCKS